MAIKLDEDNNVVVYENEPEEARPLFPNIPKGLTLAETVELVAKQALSFDYTNSTKTLSDEDLNNIVVPGSYDVPLPNSVTHKPTTASVVGRLMVISIGEDTLIQLYLSGGTSGVLNTYYRRTINKGTSWGGWYQFADLTATTNKLKFEKINLTASDQSKSTALTKDSFNLFLIACPSVTQNNGLALYYNYNNTAAAGSVLHACSAVTVTRDGLNILFTKASSAAEHPCYILKITTS